MKQGSMIFQISVEKGNKVKGTRREDKSGELEPKSLFSSIYVGLPMRKVLGSKVEGQN